MQREIQSGETCTVTIYGFGPNAWVHERLWDVEGRLVLDRRYREDDCLKTDEQ